MIPRDAGQSRRFWLTHWVTRALFLLSASAFFLALAFSLSNAVRHGMRESRPRFIPGSELSLSGAPGETRAESLWIDAVPGGQRASAMAGGLAMSAVVYKEVEVALEPYHPVTTLLFLWSSSAEPGKVHGAPLPWTGGHRVLLRLDELAEWHGTVTAVGIGTLGPLPDPIRIDHLRLAPYSISSAFTALWQDWITFEGLDGYSMNFVIGGASRVKQMVRPVPLAAVWVGTALLCYLLLAAVRRWWWDPRILGMVVVSGWMLLDGRWQIDLLRQLSVTEQRYAGRSWHEKRLAAEDGTLFRFAMEVMRNLSEEPQFLFLLTRDPEGADRYLALRARYHLLPHNVCPYYSHPPREEECRTGSYILVIHPRSDVVFDEGAERLYWDPGGGIPVPELYPSLPADRVLITELGTLYRRR